MTETTKEHEFVIIQLGEVVAAGSGSLKDVLREARHYEMVYQQDGPVEVVIDGERVQ